jgi:hypothetical protein
MVTGVHTFWVYFTLIGRITEVRTIAAGHGIRELRRLVKAYGAASWRKRKGVALVELDSGEIRRAELHWYEATGVGSREHKIKRFLD